MKSSFFLQDEGKGRMGIEGEGGQHPLGTSQLEEGCYFFVEFLYSIKGKDQ
ncbi:hypothetical protein CULT_1800006 [[Clostridium] ultunense Esp]|nr:hypothetical protein CULT_1800006 [[Clostridium] ultunense Esp]